MEQNAKFWRQKDHQIQIPVTTCDIESVLHSWKAAESVCTAVLTERLELPSGLQFDNPQCTADVSSAGFFEHKHSN